MKVDLAALWAKRRRAIGNGLLLVGVLCTLLFAFGHVGSSLLGTRVPEGQTFTWSDSTVYAKSLAGETRCRVNDANTPEHPVTLGIYYAKGGGLATNNEDVKPGGRYLAATVPKTLTCKDDVRIGSGWFTEGYRFAEAGLWTMIPTAAFLAAGSLLRRSPRSAR